jgi:hypothetical protein
MESLLAGVLDYPVSLCQTTVRTESSYEVSILDCLIVRSSNVTDPGNDTARLDGLCDGLPAGLFKLLVLTVLGC